MLLAKLLLFCALLGVVAWGFDVVLERVAKRRKLVVATRVVAGAGASPSGELLEAPIWGPVCAVCEKRKPLAELRRFRTVVHRVPVVVCRGCVGSKPGVSSWWN